MIDVEELILVFQAQEYRHIVYEYDAIPATNLPNLLIKIDHQDDLLKIKLVICSMFSDVSSVKESVTGRT